MRIGRRNLRKGLLAVGCVLGAPSTGGLVAGGALIALGGALHLWSKGCLEQNRRLITAGPYRYVRNPFYLANALIDAGLCVVVGVVWIAALFAVLWLLAYRDTIDGEERKLADLFPDEYPRYVAAVPRLVPNGSAWPRAAVTGHFSWDNDGLARGQEYARLVGIALGPAVVVAGAVLRRDGVEVFASGNEVRLASFVALPSLWVWKLAIAEAFRRPESALVGTAFARSGRLALAAGLVGLALWLAPDQAPLAILAAGWAGLALLDEFAARRTDAGTPRVRWRYLGPVALGSLVAGAMLGARALGAFA
ncbi:MAG: isoprenylcysteine carboxylmethyltransferase family protein [bacterium]|nr:isoprenylcysteine carboxylmethyltransferase family protein [bacterium]